MNTSVTPQVAAGAASTRTEAQARAEIAQRTAAYKGAYYLQSYEPPIEDRREAVKQKIELQAFVRTSGDTVCLVDFMYPAGIRIWRERKLVATVATIQELYSYCEKAGW